MLLTEYDEAKQMELFREEGREEGRAEGRTEGRAEGILTTLISLVKDGLLSRKQAADRMNLTEKEFEAEMAKQL